jgi:glycosyltransferase involved in cell wall biosynthesis
MNIAVNTRLLLKDRLEGIGWFSFETLKRITQAHPEHHFYFLFDRAYDKEFLFSKNITALKIFPPTRHAFLWYIWFEIQLPRIFKKNKIDLFISPDGYLSLNSGVPSLAVIHDINFVHRPEDIPYWANLFYNRFFPKYAKKAKRIVTVSNYSKNDIIDSFKISEEKIDVAYNGVNPIFNPIEEAEKEIIKKKYTSGEDFFVFVGAMHPRKNVAGLIKAFDHFKRNSESKIKLVIVGEMMFKTSTIKETYHNLKFKEDIVFVGRLSPENLKNVVASALALVFVPFFEGFGIPIVEAMRCGTPVICSNRTSMPEVAGQSALIVDPYNTEDIAEAMQKIANDSSLRKNLSEKGIERSKDFSWDKTADVLWSSVDKVMINA